MDLYQFTQSGAAVGVDERLASAAVTLRGDVSDAASLAEELFHHTERDIESVCDL